MKNLISLLIIISLISIACNSNHKTGTKNSINKEIKFRKDGNIAIIDSTKKVISKFDIEIADDEYERETGLMYRKSMKDNQAMLFVFEVEKPLYFYMKNTYIPLDIIFIDKNKKIVSIAKNAKVLDETTLPSKYPAKYVLEIKAGLSEKNGIKRGMKVKFQD